MLTVQIHTNNTDYARRIMSRVIKIAREKKVSATAEYIQSAIQSSEQQYVPKDYLMIYYDKTVPIDHFVDCLISAGIKLDIKWVELSGYKNSN